MTTYSFGENNSISDDNAPVIRITVNNQQDWEFDYKELVQFAELLRIIEKENPAFSAKIWRTNQNTAIEAQNGLMDFQLEEASRPNGRFAQSDVSEWLAGVDQIISPISLPPNDPYSFDSNKLSLYETADHKTRVYALTLRPDNLNVDVWVFDDKEIKQFADILSGSFAPNSYIERSDFPSRVEVQDRGRLNLTEGDHESVFDEYSGLLQIIRRWL